MIGSDKNEVSEKLFESLLRKYQENLEEENAWFRVCF